MYLTVRGLLIYFGTWFLLLAIWQPIWYKITKRGYDVQKLEGESFFDFCSRAHGGIQWKLKRKLGMRPFYNCKAFKFFMILKFFILLSLSIGVFVVLFRLSGSEYGLWLDIRF